MCYTGGRCEEGLEEKWCKSINKLIRLRVGLKNKEVNIEIPHKYTILIFFMY